MDADLYRILIDAGKLGGAATRLLVVIADRPGISNETLMDDALLCCYTESAIENALGLLVKRKLVKRKRPGLRDTCKLCDRKVHARGLCNAHYMNTETREEYADPHGHSRRVTYTLDTGAPEGYATGVAFDPTPVVSSSSNA